MDVRAVRKGVASTGPSSGDDGESAVRHPRISASDAGFNGAVVWRRRRGLKEWKRKSAIASGGGFNGAVVWRRRRVVKLVLEPALALLPASTGPSSGDDGEGENRDVTGATLDLAGASTGPSSGDDGEPDEEFPDAGRTADASTGPSSGDDGEARAWRRSSSST